MRRAALGILTTLVAACSFIDDFPDVADVVPSGGAGGGGNGGGGGSGGGGGGSCPAPGAASHVVELRPASVDEGSMDIRGLSIHEGHLFAVAQSKGGLSPPPNFTPQFEDRSVNLGFVIPPASNPESHPQVNGLSSECDGTLGGSAILAKHLTFLNGAPTAAGGFVMSADTTIGFSLNAETSACAAPTSSPNADGHQVPHLVRYSNSPAIGTAVAAGPVNAMPVAIAARNETEIAMLGMYAANTTVYDSSSATVQQWFVTRFDNQLQVIDTNEFLGAQYDVSDPEKDFGDLAYDQDGQLWVTARDCGDTGCHVRLLSGGTLVPVGTVQPDPSTANSFGSVVAAHEDLVVFGGSLDGSLSFASAESSVNIEAEDGSDTFLVAVDRASLKPVWGIVLPLPDFDAPMDIAFGTVCGVDAVLVAGCEGSLSGDCNDWAPSGPESEQAEATTAFVAAFALSDGHRLFLKEISAIAGTADGPLFASANALVVDGGTLHFSVTFQGSLEEDGTSLLYQSPVAPNGLYEQSAVVFSVPLP